MGNIVLQLSFLSNNKFLIVCDQLSSAWAYMSVIRIMSSEENPIIDEAE